MEMHPLLSSTYRKVEFIKEFQYGVAHYEKVYNTAKNFGEQFQELILIMNLDRRSTKNLTEKIKCLPSRFTL